MPESIGSMLIVTPEHAMTTWTEFDKRQAPVPGKRSRAGVSFKEHWQDFHERRGTGAGSFSQRLARARLLYLRRSENAAHWLALSVIVGVILGLVGPMLPTGNDRLREAVRSGFRASLPGDSDVAAANGSTFRLSTQATRGH
jgi:hypothetical protein